MDSGTLEQARGKITRYAARLNARHGRGLPPIILMTDDTRRVDWAEAVSALPRGAAVIVRHRDQGRREALARALQPLCAAQNVKLLVADDVALAVCVRADGVHIPQARAASVAAIKAQHPRWLVTASAHDASSVLVAGADAVLIAPVFPTQSHAGRASLGAVRLAALARATRHAYALGGVDAASVARLAALPLAGIALIGGWVRR